MQKRPSATWRAHPDQSNSNCISKIVQRQKAWSVMLQAFFYSLNPMPKILILIITFHRDSFAFQSTNCYTRCRPTSIQWIRHTEFERSPHWFALIDCRFDTLRRSINRAVNFPAKVFSSYELPPFCGLIDLLFVQNSLFLQMFYLNHYFYHANCD